MTAFAASVRRCSRVGLRAALIAAFVALAVGVNGCSSLAADPTLSPADLALIQEAMRQVERNALVPYTPAQMFALVEDIERYPEFVDFFQRDVGPAKQ